MVSLPVASAGIGNNGLMSMSGDSGQRISDAERQAAIDALNAHWRAGRLDPAEHERRTTAAYAAVTRGDLDALFTDLPSSTGAVAGPSADVLEGRLAGTSRPAADSGGFFSADSWVGQHRDALMGVVPFVALALFFITKTWVWFLLIPATGVVLYAGGDDSRRGRDRRRNRD